MMISNKKVLYSERLLQLVLALSLLQVDPINYLEWGVPRIHRSGIGPWQMEVAHTPFSDHVYMNRKTYVPLIEDLARFDRFHATSHDVQAYLLNFDNPTTPFVVSSDSASLSDNSNTAGAPVNSNNSTSEPASGDVDTTSNLLNLIHERMHNSSVDDLFLQADLFQHNESLIEQNLADLQDYEDHRPAIGNLAPIKSEPYDPWEEIVGQRQSDEEATGGGRVRTNGTRHPPAGLVRSAVIDWHDYLPFANDTDNVVVEIKKEPKDEEETAEERDNIDSTSTSSIGVVVKKEESDDDASSDDRNNEVTSNVELTVEEMDLIEVLWKQDVDLGYNPIIPAHNVAQQKKETSSEDEIEKLKALLDLKTDKKTDGEDKKDKDESEDPWAGMMYTVDTETGEYILQPRAAAVAENELLLEQNLLLEEVLQLAGIEDLNNDNNNNSKESQLQEEAAAVKDQSKEDTSGEASEDLEAILENNLKQDDFEFSLDSPLSILLDDNEDLELLNDMMIQPSTAHFQHPRQPNQNYAHCVNSYRQNSYQGRAPLSRTVSMEQRWQDLANLLTFQPPMGMPGDMSSHYSPHHYPYQASGAMSHGQQFGHHPHHPHTHPAVLHNASLADIAPQATTSHHYTSNLGSAVASSMHLTNSSTESDAGNSTYKMEHDMMYYSSNPAEMNHTSDGFLNSILSEEDVQLMDMAINEGMYTMRMLDQNATNASSALGGASGPHINGSSILNSHLQTNLTAGSSHQHNGDRLDASSDSAVSSMGSERVASLSDGEWNEGGSDSAQEYHSRKFIGPYDYRFNSSRMLDASRQPVTAQKKHQMYGKRFAHEPTILPPPLQPHSSHGPADIAPIPNLPLKYEPYEPYAVGGHVDNAAAASSSSASSVKPPASMMDSDMKYSYSIDFPHGRYLKNGSGNAISGPHDAINHNHTYTMPHPAPLNSNGATPRPQTRDKKAKKLEEEHLSRDEKRARSLHIPIHVQDIINLPMDEFNERLSKYDLSETQLSLIRDIRRRGKNKVAAQNCRKRKLDQILSLADEVKDMKMRKDRFLRDRELVMTERRRVKEKFAALYRHVFANLRDPEGNPYSGYQYSLQQSADGSVVLVPRSLEQNTTEAGSNGSGASRNGQQNGPGSNNNQSNYK